MQNEVEEVTDGLWAAGRKRAAQILDKDLMREELVDAAWDLAVIFRDLDRRQERSSK